MTYEKLTHLDLFSGIGGFSLGLEATGGFQTIGFSEIDPYASAVLRKHWPKVPNYGDVRNVPAIRCDMLTGGFPCQPFSVAGRRGGAADNRNGWPAMLACIERCRPAWVIGENVVGIASMVLAECLDDLEMRGYRARPFDVSACAAGLPTMERHIWIIASRDGHELEGHAKKILPGPAITTERNENCSSHARKLKRPTLPTAVLLRSRKGFPNFVDRIRCIGNAIPPQIAQIIGQAIYQIEQGEP